MSAVKPDNTIVIMISVGNRTHLTDYTFPRLSSWAARHGYSSLLIKQPTANSTLAPHFQKLIAPRAAPGYQRYIIVDDDLMLKINAPAMEEVPVGFVGLCEDSVQNNTRAEHVKWTANTGFIVADSEALKILEDAFADGEYPFNIWDGSNKGIWGAHDQAALNNVVFNKTRAYKLNWKWNYQAVIDFYNKDKGWHYWTKKPIYRLYYYLRVVLPGNKSHKLLKETYGLHMTMGVYPRFFSVFHK